MKREITNLHTGWFNDEEAIIKRISEILVGSPGSFKPYKKDNGNWVLDGGNNFWACVEGETLIMSDRHDSKAFDALCDFIEAWL